MVWLAVAGALFLLHPAWSAGWNSLCLLAGVSFLGAVVLPLPGATTAALVGLHASPVLATLAVLGAAVGGTAGAALLHGLGAAGRHAMKAHARRPWARRFLHWSQRLVKHWTYVGVAALLVPPFIPRVAVLYPAAVLQLRTAPFLVAVFVGTLLRNAVVLLAITLAWSWLA